MFKPYKCQRYVLAGFLTVAIGWTSKIASAQTNVPSQCFVRELGVLIIPTLRTRLISQRVQINQIATAVLKNALDNSKVTRWVSLTMRLEADKALDKALRSVSAFPSSVIGCKEPTDCSVQSLAENRKRIFLASRKLADLALKLVDRYPNLLDESAVLVRGYIENRFNGAVEVLDFLPSATYLCQQSPDAHACPQLSNR